MLQAKTAPAGSERVNPSPNPSQELRFKREGWCAGIVCVLAVTLIACGGKSSGGGATPSGKTPATTAAPANSVSGSYVRPPTNSRVIIFVNGVFGDGTSTWTNATTGKYWPALLASDPDFKDVDVYVHSFLSPHLSNAQQILELAGRMKDYLETDGVISKHTELVFLCHSMGGLVTRAFLLTAKLPPDKVPMIYFFATPTAGANIAGIAAHLSDNPQLVDMRPLEDGGYVKNLREQWLQTSNDPALNYPNRIASYCAYELKDTWSFRVVQELSATYLCNRETRAVMANHLDIVKPADDQAEQYRYFKAAYERQFGQEAAPIRQALALQVAAPMTVASRVLSLGQLRANTIVLKQVKATSQYIDVGCEEEKKGEIKAEVALGPGETVSEVHAAIANTSNLKASGAAVVQQSHGTAIVSYWIRGLDRVFLNCPGGGHADVVVNFVVTREPGLPPFTKAPTTFVKSGPSAKGALLEKKVQVKKQP